MTLAWPTISPLGSRGHFVVPCTRTAIKHHRALWIVGPSEWNSLPSELRSLPRDLSSFFYRLIKTFLFAQAWVGVLYKFLR